MKKIFLFLVSSFLIVFTLTGCAKSINYDDVKDFSDPIVNSLLTSINNLDYDTFSSYLSNDMKESYTLPVFQSETADIINNAGTFEKAEFYAGQDKNGYISLIYDVKFSNRDNTTPISITFKKGDEEHKVESIYFNSDLSNK